MAQRSVGDALVLGAVLVLGVPPVSATAAAVTRSLQESSTVTVQSVDMATRHLTVKNAAGESMTLSVPAEFRNLGSLKPGDRVTATYSLDTEIELSRNGQPVKPDKATIVAGRSSAGQLPAGIVQNKVVVTGAVLAVDQAKHTIKLVSPQGGQVHNVAVTTEAGRKMLPQVKVGDKITATLTEGLLISTARP